MKNPTAFLLLALASFLSAASLHRIPAQGRGQGRESMWPAPTAEDWKKPVLIKWQRTWEDAVALSKQTGRPILICVNMDGEVASEHYAGIRYRQPEIARLYQPYVAVIASVYRHTPRDYDEQGRRIPCPRFGTVTCGEHIAIEPILYEKFFDGKRIAPRHIMVELDGSETYDVYMTPDTDSVFRTVREGFARRDRKLLKKVRGDRSIVERVASPDSRDREAVEQAWLQGDKEVKRALLEAARNLDREPPLDLLRLALFSFDPKLSRMAREILARSNSTRSLDLITEALRIPMSEKERSGLIAALDRLGAQSVRARTLATVHRGLDGGAPVLDTEEWSRALAGGASYAAAVDDAVIDRRFEQLGEIQTSKDAGKHVDLAEAFLQRGLEKEADPRAPRAQVRALFEDAVDSARRAEELGAEGWRVNAIQAIAALKLGRFEEAHARAARAVKALPDHPTTRTSMLVLALFAEDRHDRIVAAVKKKERWPGQWLSDMHAAHTVLLDHPFGTDAQAVSHYDFLRWLGASGQASNFLQHALERFPVSPAVHTRLRRSILRTKGIDGLAKVYDQLISKPEAPPVLLWYAGYAARTAAEFQRRRGRLDEALASYERALTLFQRSREATPAYADSCDRQSAVCLAGRARVFFEKKDDDAALRELLASFEKQPAAAATLDGLNLSAVDTAMMLLQRLKDQKDEQAVAALQGALDKLDPKLLALPAYEILRRPRRR